MRSRNIKRSSSWAIDLLTRASKNLSALSEQADHCNCVKLKVIRTQVDTVLLIAKETLNLYNDRKVEDKKK